MQQLPKRKERRRGRRRPFAFTCWLQPENDQRRISAWVLDMSVGGAAMLTSADHVPDIGQRVALVEMQTTDRTVRDVASNLPRYARVVRHDTPAGLTQRIAVRFESDAQQPLRPTVYRGAWMAAVAPRDPAATFPGISNPVLVQQQRQTPRA